LSASDFSSSSIARHLRATRRAAARLATRLELGPTLEVVVETLVSDFDAALARIWLHEPGEKLLRLSASAGWSERTHESPWSTIDLAENPNRLAETARSRTAYIRNGLEGEGDVEQEWVDREKIASLGYFPLLVGDELVGVLGYFSRRPICEDVGEALHTFVAITASLINDARVFAREQAARLQAERDRQRLQTVLDTIPVGVLLAEGPEGRITMINPAGEQIGGRTLPQYTLGEFQAEVPLRYLDGRPVPTEERPLWRAVHRGERVRQTLRYRRPDGQDRILDITCAPFPGPEGGAISTYRDVTEQRRLEAELAERAGQLKALLDHLPVGVLYFDSSAVCRACNGAARILLGLGRPRSGITGVGAAEIFAAAPVVFDALNNCLLGRIPQHEPSISWPDPDDGPDPRFLDWRFEPLGVDDSAPMGALALVVDVTDRTRAEAELQTAVKASESASRNKTRFLSAVSHDLRTPVNAISLLGELLSHLVAGPIETGDEVTALVADLRQAASSLIELLNDLLELSRFDSGALEIHRSLFPLDEWLASTLKFLEVSARAKGLEFRSTVDRRGRLVWGDRVKMSRVLTNLVGNATKFTERGHVEVSLARSPDGGLVVSVSDSGPGVPGDQVDRIFDEFAQLQNPERDRTKGTGLGLAICRRLVEAVGGNLSVSSTSGVGSTFTAWYPPDHLPSDSPLASPETAASAAADFGAAPILLVEDDSESRRALARVLGRAGYAVEAATDGAEALAALERIHPSFVVLDLLMPGLDGLGFLRRLREYPGHEESPVVVVSGVAPDANGREALAALGVLDYLAKPVNFDALLDLIARHTTSAHT
jgi:signal transduction histidine kinase/CheY-like chemotaxis protein